MDEFINVTKLLLDDQKEYIILDKIVENEVVYLFLSKASDNEVVLKKYFQKDHSGDLYKLDNIEELNHAFSLFYQKHPELKNSL